MVAALLLAVSLQTSNAVFAGKWVLDLASSNTRQLGAVETYLIVDQTNVRITCSAGPAQWVYALDGSEIRSRSGAEMRRSVVKWEGAALLVNTLVSADGAQDSTIEDRWTITRDQAVLTITRQLSQAGRASEGKLVYRREGAGPRADFPAPVLQKRPEPGLAPDITIPTGTRVLLSLVADISTKHAKDGDRVYMRTDAPVVAEGRVVLPRGCDVSGTITHTKPAGKVTGKGELFIKFDNIILPNGVSRDFHGRPPREEGKIDNNGRAADGRTVMEGAGIGAGVGAITRGLPGAGVGGAAGALAGVLLSRNQDIILRKGTNLEMVLDRDLVFRPEELAGIR